MSVVARLKAGLAAMRSDRRRRTGWLLAMIGAGLLVVAGVLATVMAIRVESAFGWVEHSFEVRATARQMLSQLDAAQIGQRDFVIADSSGSLAAFEAAKARIPVTAAYLRKLIDDNPEQLARFDDIQSRISKRLKLLDDGVALARVDRSKIAEGMSTGDGPKLMAQVGRLFGEFDVAERGLLERRQDDARLFEKITLALILISLASAAVASFSMLRLGWSYIVELRQQADALKVETEGRLEAQSMLQQTQKIELLGQLTAGIAHDFNNLLTIVIGNLDTIARRIQAASTVETARISRLVETSLEGARRAATLTQRLLAFSRQQPLAPRRLDLNRAVASLSEVLERTVGETMKIETVLGGGLWSAFADPAQVDNALVNLVVNARDAMPEGGHVTIETANAHLDERYAAQFGDVAPGQYVMLSVSDTGVGIPRDILPRVFDPFFTTKDVGKGTGLGLAMIHGFVKQSKGHIRIYSEVGQGTTVKIYLPRLADSGALESAPAIGRALDDPMPRARAGEVVLLVEDDSGVREFASMTLNGLGYRVLAAGTAAEALNWLRGAERIDILFTDVVLPERMNGRQLSDEAAKLRPGLPTLFTTGYTRNAIVHDGRLDPDVRLLSKPYTPDVLAISIRQLIDGALASVG